MREPENIRAVENLGIDIIGLVFCPDNTRCVRMVSSRAGIIPDRVQEDMLRDKSPQEKAAGNANGYVARAGVFADDMPQNIITRIYNYGLDYVQLNGGELPLMIDNLRRSVDPDIHAGLKIIKSVTVSSSADIKRCSEYYGHVDMFRFCLQSPSENGIDKTADWSLLGEYDGDVPFLVGGNIGMGDVENIRNVDHPMFAGVDLDHGFETSPAVKDVDKIAAFARQLR